MRMRHAIPAFALALATLAATPAAAELFRCEGPDGEPIFTDQQGVCPGSEAYEPDGRLQTSPGARPGATQLPASRVRDMRSEAVESGMAEAWRQKRIAAEAAIASLQARQQELLLVVGHCNRGGYVTARDDAGIKQRLNCSLLKRDLAALEVEEAEARAYLAEGLPEECRKAGCLPGWIR